MGTKLPEATDAYAEMLICAAVDRMDVTKKALADAGVRGYNIDKIREVVRTLDWWKHFRRTVQSTGRVGTTQDVYYRKIENIQWYIKVVIGSKDGQKGPWLIVTFFVERGKPHVVQTVPRKTRKNKKADKRGISRRTA